MNYWIFQSVSDRYDLRTELEEGKEEPWLVSRYWQQMSPGDFVFFWLGGTPTIRGMYGWGTLTSAPLLDTDTEYQVKVKCEKKLSSPLLANKIRTARKVK